MVAATHDTDWIQLTHVDQVTRVAAALERYEQGFDLADALHLTLSLDATPLYTFDRRFSARAARHGLKVKLL